MRIFVVNLKKNTFSFRLCAVLLALTVLLSSAAGIIIDRYGESLLTVSSDSEQAKTVIIDAGHGGEDSGAVGTNGVYEKNLNLSIALLIGEMLSERGYSVIYTRTDDRLLYKPEENIKGIRKISDLKNRCAIARDNPEAFFVSIHMNSFGQSKYSGLQVYYSADNEQSRLLADSVQSKVKETLQEGNNRKIKKGKGIYLLEHIENPAVLIECGFLTNPEECEKLSDKEYQKELSFAIVCGIIEYINP